MGAFVADDVFMARTGPLGSVLDVRGTIDLQFTTMRGLPVRVTSSTPPLLHTITDVTFASMAPTEVQLYLELPGSGPNSPLNMSFMIFDSPGFNGGAHIQTVRGGALTDVMTVELFNPSPAAGGSVVIQGPNTSVIWP